MQVWTQFTVDHAWSCTDHVWTMYGPCMLHAWSIHDPYMVIHLHLPLLLILYVLTFISNILYISLSSVSFCFRFHFYWTFIHDPLSPSIHFDFICSYPYFHSCSFYFHAIVIYLHSSSYPIRILIYISILSLWSFILSPLFCSSCLFNTYIYSTFFLYRIILFLRILIPILNLSITCFHLCIYLYLYISLHPNPYPMSDFIYPPLFYFWLLRNVSFIHHVLNNITFHSIIIPILIFIFLSNWFHIWFLLYPKQISHSENPKCIFILCYSYSNFIPDLSYPIVLFISLSFHSFH